MEIGIEKEKDGLHHEMTIMIVIREQTLEGWKLRPTICHEIHIRTSFPTKKYTVVGAFYRKK